MLVGDKKQQNLLRETLPAACGSNFLIAFAMEFVVVLIFVVVVVSQRRLAKSTIFVTSEHLAKMRKLLAAANVSMSTVAAFRDRARLGVRVEAGLLAITLARQGP